MAAADPATAASSFSQFSFRRAVCPSPLRVRFSRPHPPARLRVSSTTVVALHKRNPKRLKYAAQRQFSVLSASSACSSFFRFSFFFTSPQQRSPFAGFVALTAKNSLFGG